MERSPLLKFASYIFIFLWACPAFAWQSLAPEHINIEFVSPKKAQESDDEKFFDEHQQWLTACKKIGKNLTAQGGVWATGPFRAFSCIENKNLVFGEKVPAAWELRIAGSGKDLKMTLSMRLSSKKKRLMGRFTLPRDKSNLLILSIDGFADLLGVALVNELPFSSYMTKAAYEESKLKFTVRPLTISKDILPEPPTPPENLTLQNLSFDLKQKIWHGKMLASATISTKKLKNGDLTWRIKKPKDEDVEPVQEHVWIMDALGPRARHDIFQESLNQAHENYLKIANKGDAEEMLAQGFNITAPVAPPTAYGYIGVRYGMQLLSSDALTKQSVILGVLAELRHGPLSGLRLYYDKLPKVEAKIDEHDVSLEWSRLIIGKSWDFNLGILFDSFTLTPKIGQWNLQGVLPAVYDNEGLLTDTSEFSVKNALALAMEVGLEKKSSQFLLRGWYSYDTAINIKKNSGRSVTSNRVGLDTFIIVGDSFNVFSNPLKVSVLGFYVYESIQLNDPSKKAQAGDADADLAIESISYQGGYAGVGLAISW